MKKLFLLFIFLMLAVSASAEQEKRTGIDLDIKHTIAINGVPTTSALCNITAFDPDFITLVSNRVMTPLASSNTYNYTLNSTMTEKIGDYNYDISCSGSGLNTTEHFSIPLTTTGKAYSTADSITNLLILFASISIFCLFLYGSIKINPKTSNNEFNEVMKIPIILKQTRLLLMILCYLTFVWITWVLWNLTLGYSQLLAVSAFFWFLHRLFFALLWPVGLGYILYSVIIFVKDLNLQDKISKGRITLDG